MVAFIDPSSQPSNPGWPLRNLLTYLRHLDPSSSSTLRALCWRDVEPPAAGKPWRSRFGVVVSVEVTGATDKPGVVGWEKNVHGKLGARVADLAPMMDPKRCIPFTPPFRNRVW